VPLLRQKARHEMTGKKKRPQRIAHNKAREGRQEKGHRFCRNSSGSSSKKKRRRREKLTPRNANTRPHLQESSQKGKEGGAAGGGSVVSVVVQALGSAGEGRGVGKNRNREDGRGLRTYPLHVVFVKSLGGDRTDAGLSNWARGTAAFRGGGPCLEKSHRTWGEDGLVNAIFCKKKRIDARI